MMLRRAAQKMRMRITRTNRTKTWSKRNMYATESQPIEARLDKDKISLGLFMLGASMLEGV